MKKTIITAIATVLVSFTVKSQINLENSYPIINTNKQSGLTIIKLESSGEKYCLYEMGNRRVKLYNMNHSIFKTINILPLNKYRTYNTDSIVSIAYISETLFNTDNLIEVLTFDGNWYSTINNNSLGSMNIFNEQGALLFSGDSLMPCSKSDASYYGMTDGNFIFNSSVGAKMILYSYKNNTLSQQVYSLPGQLITSIQKTKNESLNALPFPNPTINSITVPYKLDNGKEGKLVINDINGKMLFEYKIDTNFDNVLVDTNAMTAGNYFYSIYSSDKKVATGKFIVTK